MLTPQHVHGTEKSNKKQVRLAARQIHQIDTRVIWRAARRVLTRPYELGVIKMSQ